VRALKHELGLAVIEMFVVGIHAIVAIEALGSPRQVRLGEGRVEAAVTVHAGGGFEGGQLLLVAIFADEGSLRGGQRVTVERVFGHVMRKFRPRRFERERSRRAKVFGMTVHTPEFGIFVIHFAVRFGDLGHVRSQVCVTILATVGHRARIPRRGMAESALAADLRVRRDPAHGSACLGI